MNKIIFIALVTILLAGVNARQIDCNGREFVCYDERRFYQCVQNGESRTIIGSLQECPTGLNCRDDGELECDNEITIEEDSNQKSKLIEILERNVLQEDSLMENNAAESKNFYSEF